MRRLLRSFNARIFMTVICVAMVPIVLCLTLMLPVMISSSEHRQALSAQEQLAQMGAALSESLDGLCRTLDMLTSDEAAVDAATGRSAGGAAQERTVYGAMVSAAACAPGLTQLYILSSEGECLHALRGAAPHEPLATDWGALRMADGTQTVFCAVETEIWAVRRMEGGEGYALAVLGGETLRSLLAQGRDPASGVMLLDTYWRMIYDSQTTGSASRIHDVRERLLAGQTLQDRDSALVYTIWEEPHSGFTLLLSQPRLFTAETKNMIGVIGVTMAALSLGLCVWGALVLSRTLSRPVREMTKAMERVERGELSVRLMPRGDDELGVLAAGFNRMVEEYEQNLRRTVERQKELNDTRIRMMQAQLNPHFLYNTLDSMKWMGVTHGVPQVATLAEDLAGILRTSISGDEFVTLEQELELLERYIDIQLIRFEDRFACEIEVDDAYMRLLVPKLVLQPIVENAVIHGVRDMDDGYIKIWADSEGGDLRLYVRDNGRGMDSEQNGALGDGVSGRPGEHLGLYNVNNILQLHFGSAYGLSICSHPNEGCLVMVRLPMREGHR